MFKTNNQNDIAHIESDDVDCVNDFKTGESPSRVETIKIADLAVAATFTTISYVHRHLLYHFQCLLLLVVFSSPRPSQAKYPTSVQIDPMLANQAGLYLSLYIATNTQTNMATE
jgi:hypothetical protein